MTNQTSEFSRQTPKQCSDITFDFFIESLTKRFLDLTKRENHRAQVFDLKKPSTLLFPWLASLI